MVKYFAIVLVAFVAAQASSVAARASEPPAEKNVWDTLAEDARKAVKDFADATGLSDINSEKFVQKLEADAKSVAKNVDSFVNTLKKDIDNKKPEVEKILKKVQAELTKTSDDLKKLVGPDAKKRAEEIKASFDKNVNAAIAQVNHVIKAVEPDATKLKADLEASGKELLNSIVEGAKTWGANAKAAASKN